ncbi:MAG: hypothetical protein WD426_06125 [Anditalea sp.]
MLQHKNNPPWFTVNFDSSSGLVKALSNCLHGKSFAGVGTIPNSQLLGKIINVIPPKLQKNIYVYGSAKGAKDPEKLGKVDSNEFSEWVSSLYPKQKYPALLIGASNGPVVHLAAAMGIPWLPQTFLIPVKTPNGLDVDEPIKRMEWGRQAAKQLLKSNPYLQLHHMMDPNQDRPMLRKTSYFRVKQIRLTSAYKQFILENLKEDGILYIVDCRKKHPVTKVDERHYFQFGGLGGTSIDEYINGSDDVKHFLQRVGSKHKKWDCPKPTGEMPESEWGFEPTLQEDILELAQKHGFKVRSIVFDEPETLSPLVADLYRSWYKERGITYNQLLVGTFFLMDPYWTLKTGSVPFWLAFNGKPSADYLNEYLKKAAAFENIYLLPFSHGIDGMGLASEEYLRSILSHARSKGEFIGAEPGKYPYDFGIYARFEKTLQKKIATRIPDGEKLRIDQLEKFIQHSKGKYEVEWPKLL